MTLDGFDKLARGISSLTIAGTAIWGVSRYSVASRAEARARRSAEVETEAKIAQQFDALLKIAESYGDTGPIQVGLARQKSSIRSIVRIVRLHPKLKDAALAGLRSLREFPGMVSNHADLDAAIAEIGTTPDVND